MLTTLNKNTTINRLFYFFIFVHLVAWAFVPAIIRDNLPLDSIEGTIWGHQLQWGYDKNPFLNGWLTALAVYLDGQQDWMVYFFSQFSVIVCFWSVWQLAKRMLTPTYALLSVLLLEGIQYYNFHSIDFNDNTLELGLWGLTTWFFYCATNSHHYEERSSRRGNPSLLWIATGLFAALGTMAKYYTLSLLAAMALFLILQKTTRQQLKTLPPYLGLITFLVIILPHVIWLFSHEFITVTYVFDRASSPPSWTNHILYPLTFIWQQFEAFLPAIVLFFLLWIGNKKYVNTPSRNIQQAPLTLNTFDRDFLLYIGLGPTILTAILSILFGITLRAGWGMPLQSLWGLLLIAYWQPVITQKRLYTFLAIIYSMITLLSISYVVSLVKSPDPSSANFPGKEIASTITQQWHNTYHTKLDYVAGSRWVGGNIGFYSSDQPAVFIEWNKKRAPWIDVDDLRKKGGIFIWNLSKNESMPDSVKQQFPTLKAPIIYEFNWKRNAYHLPPSRIAVAVLPPEQINNNIHVIMRGKPPQ